MRYGREKKIRNQIKRNWSGEEEEEEEELDK